MDSSVSSGVDRGRGTTLTEIAAALPESRASVFAMIRHKSPVIDAPGVPLSEGVGRPCARPSHGSTSM